MKKLIYLVAPLMCFSTLVGCNVGGDEPPTPPDPITYKVTFTSQNCELYEGTEKITEKTYKEKTKLELKVKTDTEQYYMPESVTITDTDTQETYSGYSYDKNTGNLTINSISANLTINADASLVTTYKVTFTGNNCDLYEGTEKITEKTYKENTKIQFTVKPDTEKYCIPESVTITDTDTKETYSGYSYDKNTGNLTINSISANLTITSSATEITFYKISFEGQNCELYDGEKKITGEETYKEKTKLELKVKTNTEQYYIPTEVTIKNTDTQETYSGYSYDKNTGNLTINSISANLTISAISPEIKKYKVTWQNWDKQEIYSEYVEFGVIPSYSGSNPTKASDDFGSYSFEGWDHQPEEVHSNQTYTAVFKLNEIDSTVTSITINLADTDIGKDFTLGNVTPIDNKTARIDWGDSSDIMIVDDHYVKHQYQEAGEYTVLISNLKQISCPSNKNLTKVKLGNAMTSTAYGGFSSCSNLTEISIPDSITIIEGRMFYYCPKLKTINIPKNLTEIGTQAFYDCDNLISIELPDSLTTIGNFAFESCSYLESINIPKNVNSIGTCAFRSCRSLKNVTVDKDNVTYNSNNNCNAIIETNTNTLIVGSLNTSVVPNNVTKIGDFAFKNSNITSIKTGTDLLEIGEECFFQCSELEELDFSNTKAKISFYSNNSIRGCDKLARIIVPAGLFESYKEDTKLSAYSGKIVSAESI